MPTAQRAAEKFSLPAGPGADRRAARPGRTGGDASGPEAVPQPEAAGSDPGGEAVAGTGHRRTTPDELLRAGFDAAAMEKAQIAARRASASSSKTTRTKSRPCRSCTAARIGPGCGIGRSRNWPRRSSSRRRRPAPLERLWQAYEAVEPEKVQGHGGKQLVDVVALVRHALDPNSPLVPVGMTVEERYQQWLADQAAAGVTFTPEQRHGSTPSRTTSPAACHRAGRFRRRAVQPVRRPGPGL